MTEYFSVPELLAKTYWKEKRLYYDGSNNLIYLALNSKINASESDQSWLVYRLTWSAGNLIRLQGPIEGAAENRTSLEW